MTLSVRLPLAFCMGIFHSNDHEGIASPRQMKDTVWGRWNEVDQIFRNSILKCNVIRQADSYPGINRKRSHSNKTLGHSGLKVNSA